MYIALASYKGVNQWSPVSNFGQQFLGEIGIMEFMIEEMSKRFPNIEYKLEKVN